MRTYRKAGKFKWVYDVKGKARCYLNVYVRRGKVEKFPCSKCGNPKSQGHHTNYAKPLDVEWLCAKCHYAEHHKAA